MPHSDGVQHSETEGLLDDVEQEESDTEEQFPEHITMNTAIKPILDKIQGLVEELDKYCLVLGLVVIPHIATSHAKIYFN